MLRVEIGKSVKHSLSDPSEKHAQMTVAEMLGRGFSLVGSDYQLWDSRSAWLVDEEEEGENATGTCMASNLLTQSLFSLVF